MSEIVAKYQAAPAVPPLSSGVADREFALEIRRGLLIIMRACMRRFRMTWADFLPQGMAVIEADGGH